MALFLLPTALYFLRIPLRLANTSLKTTQIHAKIVDTKISEDMNQLQKTLSTKDLNKPEGAGINISDLNKYGIEPNLNLLQRNITSYN